MAGSKRRLPGSSGTEMVVNARYGGVPLADSQPLSVITLAGVVVAVALPVGSSAGSRADEHPACPRRTP